MNQTTESILIVGTGALACLFAARFAAVGLPVTILGNWLEGVQALQERGVYLIDIDGSKHIFPVHVIRPPEHCHPFSHALILVKSWQTERTARQLIDYMVPSGCVLTLQNGLGNHEILMRELSQVKICIGVTTTGARLVGPGNVQASGIGRISLTDDSKLILFRNWFTQAGFLVQTVSDMNGLIWSKLIVNAAINPLTALLQVRNGDLLRFQAARSLLVDVAREVMAVAITQGISLPLEDPVKEVEDVALRTGTNYSSMLQDILRSAPTEIDAINGAIIEYGSKLGVPTPINETLYQLIKALVEKHIQI